MKDRWYYKVFLANPASPDREPIEISEVINIKDLKCHINRRKTDVVTFTNMSTHDWLIDKAIQRANITFPKFDVAKVVVKELNVCQK